MKSYRHSCIAGRGHLACLAAYIIFAFNIIICKKITNTGLISPIAIFTYRALGATLFFWIASLFLPREKVAPRDLGLIALASMFGLFLTQFMFLLGIKHTTPMDCSLLTTLSPIFTMFIAAIAVKEPITWKKAGGVAISFTGVTLLIINSSHQSGDISQSEPIGILLILLNGLSWACYLGIFRNLIGKYSVVTFMKWMFLFSLAASLPFGTKEVIAVDYAAADTGFFLDMGFVILFATCIAYLLIPVGQKRLRPTVVSLYSYVQPLTASIISIFIGMDSISFTKVISAVAMVGGAILVNKSRKASR